MAQILHSYCPNCDSPCALDRNRIQALGVWMSDTRAKIMKRDNGSFGLIIGGIVALAAVMFILSGGELGGKKTIEGDQDLPPIASTDR